ncbi:MAG: hypothetical protein ABS81_18485 [Pseudonocardia sp. SCN 72-86]|nr:MAG: hypothetical protein ABS81_18485 [Pseudonocardia sp. SCN 72-86]
MDPVAATTVAEAAGSVPAAVVTVAVTCRLDSRSHAVPDTELTRTAAADTGRYQAICGHVVSPASLVAPDGKPCDACSEATPASGGKGRRRRRPA